VTKRIATAMIVLALLASPLPSAAQAINALTPQEKADGWQLLFDGASLKGWHASVPPQGGGRGRAAAPQPPPQTAPPARPGALPQIGSSPKPCVTRAAQAAAAAGASHWEVVDGLLVACGEPTGYLTSDASYKDFRLSLEFRCGGDTNSGVFVRSPQENGGYEVQIWRKQPAGYNTGAIVGTAKTARDFRFKPDEWNRYEITAEGDHIVVVLNGETTLDIHDAKFAEGNLRLQYQQFPIAFRNIKIRPRR
jgi:3-keto-disaccharide hydrolase